MTNKKLYRYIPHPNGKSLTLLIYDKHIDNKIYVSHRCSESLRKHSICSSLLFIYKFSIDIPNTFVKTSEIEAFVCQKFKDRICRNPKLVHCYKELSKKYIKIYPEYFI